MQVEIWEVLTNMLFAQRLSRLFKFVWTDVSQTEMMQPLKPKWVDKDIETIALNVTLMYFWKT